MSDSGSDTEFESADEGEELLHSEEKVSHNLTNIVSAERLLCSVIVSNDKQEKCCNAREKEEMECNSVRGDCNKDMTESAENSDNDNAVDTDNGLNCNTKTPSVEEKQHRIIGYSNKENVDWPIVDCDNSYDTRPKYTKDTYITEKSENDICWSEMKTDEPKQPVSKSSNNDFNSEKVSDFVVRESNKNKHEKPERIVLKVEKRLSEKSKRKKNTDEIVQPGNSITSTNKEECFGKLDNTKQEQTSSWGWGNWSSSLLATAASSVSAFTIQVSEGIGTVLETVESTLGAPPPEELAAAIESKKKELNNCSENVVESEADEPMQTPENSSGLFDVSSLSKVIENTGSKVLTTGLDTLELIGRTTIDILTEGDPGLRKKRAYFKSANLSEMLREAKEKVEATHGEDDVPEAKSERIIHYTTLFDSFQGIAHLEALEMLSKQNKTMLQGWLLSVAEDDNVEAKERINEIQEMCENLPAVDDTLEENHQEFLPLIKNYTGMMELNLNIGKFDEVHKRIHEWLENCKKEQDKGEAKDAMELHHEGLKSMAHLTACSMELFHKVGEMMLYKSPDVISAVSLASYLIDATSILCSEIGIIAAKFCQCLNTAADDSEDPDSIAPFITNVYLEASNSNTYIQDAFQLLVPILQMVAIKQIESHIYKSDPQKCDT